jgi:catechol 2,3-dioxygenase-like lactoylglutathione lyase family enzyme
VQVKVERIDHVALRVRDVERTVLWYQDVMGLDLDYRAPEDGPVFLCAGSTCLSIFPAGPVSPMEAVPSVRLNHIAFLLTRENYLLGRQELRRRGIPFRTRHHPRSDSTYFEDPDGFTLEITTYDITTLEGRGQTDGPGSA